MPAKKHEPEEIVGKPSEVEIVLARAGRALRHAGGSRSESRRTTAAARGGAVGEHKRVERSWRREGLHPAAAGRSGAFLKPRRGQGADRGVASRQHRPAAQQPRLPTTGSGSGDTAIVGHPNYPVGAAQSSKFTLSIPGYSATANANILCGYGETGRRNGFRYRRVTVGVRVPLAAPFIRTLAFANA